MTSIEKKQNKREGEEKIPLAETLEQGEEESREFERKAAASIKKNRTQREGEELPSAET